MSRSALTLCFFMALNGCVFAQGTNPPQPQPKADKAGEDLVVARVAGDIITEKQVLSAIEEMTRRQQPQLSLQQMQQRNSLLFKPALDNLVNVSLLKREVAQKHVTVDPAKVEQNYRQMTQGMKPEEIKAAMDKQGLNEASLKKSIEENLSYTQVLEDAVKAIPSPSEDAAKKFYIENPQSFNVPEQVRAAHILLKVDPNAKPEQKAEIRKKIESLRADLESKKITFAEAAAKYSEDPSNAQKGGDLGKFGRGQMVKPFEDAAFATKPGTLSPVVETNFGYHIIQVMEVKPAGKAPFEEAKPLIVNYLNESARQTAAEKYLADLKAGAKIEMFMTQEEWTKRHP
jgi:peptidyl-prolyl cis-trans isomerase C